MQSPLALIVDDDAAARERAREALARAGITAVAVASPREALDVLRRFPGSDDRSMGPDRIDGRSEAAGALVLRIRELAELDGPVLFAGEAGSGRAHAARSLHGWSTPSEPFTIVPEDDPAAFEVAFRQQAGTVFVASIERLPWPKQEALAAAAASPNARGRLLASTALDPRVAVEDGRMSKALIGAFRQAIVRIPPLRERSADIAVLTRSCVEELCRLNGLAPIAVSADALAALETYPWPGNVRQLRSAIESAVILAEGGTLRARDLPEYLRRAGAPAADAGRADRRFRDAKRSVVDAFERAYLEDLLKRHGGNVTGAAEQSGMLRSALQRLLRKHELHSADFRSRGGPSRYAS